MTRRDPTFVLATIAMALVPWLIQPGLIEPDTKVDLGYSPWRYLGRALSAWNDHAGLGELQNQAYGYLFPMGPVYGIARTLGMPVWATQRVWWTLLILVAFTGTRHLVLRLGLAGPRAALVGAAAYALGPRVLTLLAANSVEAWPYAVAPWAVLAALPLLSATLSRRRRWHALAACGLVATALGGVNATASGIVLVLPALLLLLHPVGRRRVLPWAGASLVGALWWLIPLAVLGRYAYPFLDYIETASITTAVTSAPNTLRGANDWVAYILDSAGHPVWQGGWVTAQSETSIVATCSVAAVGCVGLLRTHGLLRRWLLACVLTGFLVMTIGHPGTFGSPVAWTVRSLLDGPLAILRNVHKAEPLLRLPLSLGVAVMCLGWARRAQVWRRWVPAAVVLVVVAAMTPLWQGRVGDAFAFSRLPDRWVSAAHQVDRMAQSEGGSTLLLPTSRTATYRWRRTTDEPLSALATSPVVVRASAPLGAPAATRLLDAADALAGSAQPQPALAAGLARMGIARIVVRHDLDPAADGGSWQRVEATLASSPGFSRVFSDGSGTNGLTVWRVAGSRSMVSLSDGQPSVLSGGPEAVFAALAASVISPTEPTWLSDAVRAPPAIITDTLRWRAYNNGRPVTDAYSPTLTADDRQPLRAGARDLLPAGTPATQPHRVVLGARSVTVSSSAADPFAKAYRGPAYSQWAALDTAAGTPWLTGRGEHTATYTVTFATPTVPGTITVRPAAGVGIDRPQRIEVRADNTSHAVPATGGAVTIDRPVRSVTIRLLAAGDLRDPVLGLASVTMSHVALGSVIAVPTSLDPASQVLLLSRDARVDTNGRPDSEDGLRIDRQLTIGAAADNPPLTVWMRAPNAGSVPAACGAVGSVRIGQTTVPLQAAGSAARNGALVPARPCARFALAAGTVRVSAVGAGGWVPDFLTLGQRPAGASATAIAATGSPSHGLRLTVPAGPAGRVLTIDQGANAGWSGPSAGHDTDTPPVDGWRQSFVVTGAAGPVRITFSPSLIHRWGLGVGALAVLGLALTWLLTAGRRGRDAAIARTAATWPVQGSLANDATAPPWPRWVAPVVTVVVAGLCAGPAGVLVALGVLMVPRRWHGPLAAIALVLAGIALAALGVVDSRSLGATSGQLLGTVTAGVLAAGWARDDAPPAGSAPPPMTTKPTRSSR